MLIRFRNRGSGSTVRVDEATAGRLSQGEWERLTVAPAPSPEGGPVEVAPELAMRSPAPVGGAVPAGNASRGEWAAYAVSLGCSVDGLKRDEIRDLVAGGQSKGAAELEVGNVSSD